VAETIDVSWQVLLWVLPVMVFSGLVHGALGLGFPMVATPIIAVFLDVKLAILITLLPTAAVNLASIRHQRGAKDIVAKYWPLAGSSLVGAVVGAYVLSVADASAFRLLLAVLILIFLWTQYRGRLPREWFTTNHFAVLVVIGLLAGFSAGTTNVMVAILIIYFLSAGVQRGEMVGAMNLCFLIGKLSQIVVFFAVGLMNLTLLVKTVPLAVAALVALSFGQNVSEKISPQRYTQWLRYLLAVLAAILLWQFFSGR
jgi:uncharacterized membrane protein YfcA